MVSGRLITCDIDESCGNCGREGVWMRFGREEVMEGSDLSAGGAISWFKFSAINWEWNCIIWGGSADNGGVEDFVKFIEGDIVRLLDSILGELVRFWLYCDGDGDRGIIEGTGEGAF